MTKRDWPDAGIRTPEAEILPPEPHAQRERAADPAFVFRVNRRRFVLREPSPLQSVLLALALGAAAVAAAFVIFGAFVIGAIAAAVIAGAVILTSLVRGAFRRLG
jgi:hypothetical protein